VSGTKSIKELDTELSEEEEKGCQALKVNFS